MRSSITRSAGTLPSKKHRWSNYCHQHSSQARGRAHPWVVSDTCFHHTSEKAWPKSTTVHPDCNPPFALHFDVTGSCFLPGKTCRTTVNAFFNEIAREASKEWTPNGSYLHKRLSAVELLVLKKACKETPLYKKQGSNADAAFAH